MSADAKTPAELLRSAAALLRERAAKATPSPWNYCRIDGHGDTPERAEVFAGPIDGYGYLAGSVASWAEEDEDGQRLSHEDGAWLEAVHPGLGEPLAAWLEQAADSLERHLPSWTGSTGGIPGEYPPIVRTAEDTQALVEHHYGPALAVARVVLREEIPVVSA